jgi:hypothetical protein
MNRDAGPRLEDIPGVGPSIARDLRAIGIRRPAQLKGRNPERLYEQVNGVRGVRQDRCLLYVFRCAVYFASTARPRPRLLKWWNWSDAHRRGR